MKSSEPDRLAEPPAPRKPRPKRKRPDRVIPQRQIRAAQALFAPGKAGPEREAGE